MKAKYKLLDQSDVIELFDEWYDVDNDSWILADCVYNKLGLAERGCVEDVHVGTQWDQDYPPFRRKLEQ